MQKVLVVGCGGSGAQTLAFMMDQLKTTLAERLPHRYPTPKDVVLPAAWQFVSVDVPTVAEKAGKNLPNVSEAGGHYISCGTSARYLAVDTAVSQQLRAKRDLGTIASWAIPKPDEETTSVADGAGQFRAIGRMLILSKLRQVQTELEKAWEILFKSETNRELSELRSEWTGKTQIASDAGKEQPLIFVVSSMAGGAGASMAIDVCRLLTGLDGVTSAKTSLFMVTPDIFSKLAPDAIAGTNPNAMAMFSELAAAQFGAAAAEDVRLFRALGVPVNATDGIPVGRVFPVGVRSGERGAVLGDGHPKTVYRALGRGLAALMTDENAMGNFVAFRLGNKQGLVADSNLFGWGVTEEKTIPWGSFGYAQLSMGRDRYGEYAAQRLASSAVHRLLNGHYDPTNPASGDAQIQEKLNNNLPSIQSRLGKFLPPPKQVGEWIHLRFQEEIQQWSQLLAARVRDRIPSSAGQRGSDWLPAIEQALRSVGVDAQQDVNGLLYAGVFQWASPEEVQEKFLELLRAEIAKYGAPYGKAVLALVRGYLEESIIGATRSVSTTMVAPGLSPEMRTSLAKSKGKITDDSAFIYKIVEDTIPQLQSCAVVVIARNLVPVFEDLLKNFVIPLQNVLQREHEELQSLAAINNDPNLGVAQLKTDVPLLWPDETQVTVPDRFNQAPNEVFLTDVETFPRQFEHDIVESAKDAQTGEIDFQTGLVVSAQRVVSANWQSMADAEQAPQDLLVLVESWIPRELTAVPGGAAELRDPRPARFSLNISPAKILERSRQYIRRKGFSFQQFISTSLREYITAPHLSDQERRQRRQQVISRFTEAMTNALPLAQINGQLVRELYNSELRYNFNFSKIPFGGDEIAPMLEKTVLEYPNHMPPDRTAPLGGALSNQGNERAIDIFGSYPNYVPVVFDSLLPPIVEQWDSLSARSRVGFWTSRRTRPLPAALPMSDKERHAMVAGWYIGRLTGTVYCPGTLDASDDEPVQVFDHISNSWVNFDQPMLTPVSRFRNNLDWLPNLLESSALAWARVGEMPLFNSIRPYMLLRGLYDSEPQPSNTNRTLRGQRLLQEWLFSGERKSQEQHRIPGTEPAVTPEERLQAAKEWLQRQGNNAQAYVPTALAGAGQLHVTTNREFADITDRKLAAIIPTFYDLAPDIVRVTAELTALLDRAYAAGPPQISSNIASFAPTSETTTGFSMPGEGEF